MSSTTSHAAGSPRQAAGALLASWMVLTLVATGLMIMTPERAAAQGCDPATARCAATPAGTPAPTPDPVPTSAPLPPTGLSVTGTSSSSASLAWGESLHATSYEVERATGETGAFETIATPSGRSYTDTGLTAGTQYRYRVRGVNLSGAGPYSSEVVVIPRNGICTTAVTAASAWDGGYVLDITITNASAMTFVAWQSSVTLPAGHAHIGSWPGTPRVSGQTVTQANQPWNGALGPGQSARWGLQASRPSGDDAVPAVGTCVVAVPAAS